MNKNIFKKFVVLLSLSLVFLGFNFAHAEDININLQIKVGTNNLYDRNISVSSCDSNNDGNIDEATAYCALSQSKLSIGGSWSDFGYFLESINNISGYPDANGGEYHYWAFYSNGEYSLVGANSYVLKPGDIILFDFTDPSEEDIAKAATSNSGGVLVKDTFHLDKAVEFLSLNQEEDGSFGNSLYTDWVAIGIAKTKEKNTDSMISLLAEYLKMERFEGKSITDYERHAMALMALGINPYDGTDINYISKIVNSFDGNQIGEKGLINDDIFSLIVLQNVGYGKDDELIQKIISNILSSQSVNGSWGGVDMTAASIMALYDFKNIPGVNESIVKAYKFMKITEKENKNFGNSFSTSWVMQAFGLEYWYEDEVSRGLEFLTRNQDNEDGFMKEDQLENRIWATAYSIPAVLNLSWSDILYSFPKQIILLEEKLIKPIIFEGEKNKNIEEVSKEENNLEDLLSASVINSTDVLPSNSDDKSFWASLIDSIKRHFSSLWFKLISLL